MRIVDLLREVTHESVAGPTDRDVLGVTPDSRQVRPGYLFVAVHGERLDGDQFVAEAVQRGAIGVLCETPASVASGVCLVRVADSRLALAQLACAFHGHPADKLRAVGVTGTNGKTTVAFVLRDFLVAADWRPGLIGTVQYEMGGRTIPAGRTTPEASELQSLLAQMVRQECRSVVMEVSSHSLVQHRVHGIAYDVGVFTNVTRDHLDYHKTVPNYFAAKRLLFLGLGARRPAVAVINADDSWGRQLLADPEVRAPKLSFGFAEGAAVRAVDARLAASGSVFRVVTPWGEAQARTSLLGRFNVSNSLAAIAAGGSMGLGLDLMVATLGRVRRVPGRLEEVPTGRGFQVFVDYAHTDDALCNVLQTLREIVRGRLVVVFGCGGNRDRTKRPAMGTVAAKLADHTVLTSDNPRREDPEAILAEIRAGIPPGTSVESIVDRAAAIERAIALARDGDIVLVAGKGHEAYQEFANTVTPFDDRQVVRRILGVR
jgi:UDP-N-acetylmuramoyl-L-alanyl-D-glutamate--2,6-diaminopimelate ligase